MKKFFTSSQDSAGLSDHNYSQSPRTISSQLDSDNESRGSSNCFLLDSDGELDSGDPEIVFNHQRRDHENFEVGLNLMMDIVIQILLKNVSPQQV